MVKPARNYVGSSTVARYSRVSIWPGVIGLLMCAKIINGQSSGDIRAAVAVSIAVSLFPDDRFCCCKIPNKQPVISAGLAPSVPSRSPYIRVRKQD